MRLKLCFASLLLTACNAPGDNGNADGVDSVYFNAQAYTLDESQPWVQAIAVDGDSIVFVGDNAGALALAGDDTAKHDLSGQMLLPGFIDAHTHLVFGGELALSLSLDTFGTPDDWVVAIDEYAKANPDRAVLFGYGFLASAFGASGPHRTMIDAVVPDRPVFIMDEGSHSAWANTKALEALNITQDTLDPAPGFSYYKRDDEGNATGYLLENAATQAMQDIGAITIESTIEGTEYVIDVMNAYGITAAFDAGVLGAGESLPYVLEALDANGHMTVRIVGSSMAHSAEQFDGAVDRAAWSAENLRGDNYHYNTLKIMDDGTVEGRTAAMFEDYQNDPGNDGETVFTEAQMISMVSDAAAQSMDVHIHALGERAVHEALNAIEAARERHEGTGSRFTLTHIQAITDQDLPRFAELDVIAQSTPLWSSYDEYGRQFVSEDQFNRFWRFASLRDLGVRFTSGSDFPASGAGTLGISPVVQIEIGHTRQYAGEPDAPIQPRESERLDLETLIRSYTIDAAYQLHMEDQIGSLEVGKLADLVVLDQNLFEIDAYEIHKTGVVMTVLGGEIVYQR